MPKQAEEVGPGGDRSGTVNYENGTNWWFTHRLLLFKEVVHATIPEELQGYVGSLGGASGGPIAADVEVLGPLLQRRAISTMGGAIGHTGQHPFYVQREGAGGLFGAGGAGRHSEKKLGAKADVFIICYCTCLACEGSHGFPGA